MKKEVKIFFFHLDE